MVRESKRQSPPLVTSDLSGYGAASHDERNAEVNSSDHWADVVWVPTSRPGGAGNGPLTRFAAASERLDGCHWVPSNSSSTVSSKYSRSGSSVLAMTSGT